MTHISVVASHSVLRSLFHGCTLSLLLLSLPLKPTEIPPHLKSLLAGLLCATPQKTGFYERRKYGFHGNIVPIFNVPDKSLGDQIGCIITDGQPIVLGGLWSATSAQPTHHIFIDQGTVHYSAEITTREQSILACVAENNEKIAIAWEYPYHTYIRRFVTFADVDSIKQGKIIDLFASGFDKTALELKD
jgi:hypothetical protein